MTRINAGIPVKQLTDEHLRAEHREIKRLCSNYKKWKGGSIPNEFKLGTGHVLFFMNKGKYTFDRYKELYQECLDRGFKISDFSDNWSIYNGSNKDFNNYTPTADCVRLLKERIIERIHEGKVESFHYNKKAISKQEAINLLN